MRVLARSCGGAAAPNAPVPAGRSPPQRSSAQPRLVIQAAGLGRLHSTDRQAAELSAHSSDLKLGCYAARAAIHLPACSAAHLVCRKAWPAAGPSCPSAQASQHQLPPTREPLQLGPCPARAHRVIVCEVAYVRIRCLVNKCGRRSTERGGGRARVSCRLDLLQQRPVLLFCHRLVICTQAPRSIRHRKGDCLAMCAHTFQTSACTLFT